MLLILSDVYLSLRVVFQKLVLVGGPNDGAITPWHSTQFGYFKEGSLNEIETMRETKMFTEDSFGLRTLDEKGAIVMCSAYTNHTMVVEDSDTYERCIKPYIGVGFY